MPYLSDAMSRMLANCMHIKNLTVCREALFATYPLWYKNSGWPEASWII